MRLLSALVSLLLFTAGPALAKGPVLVELFTSQGCAACSDANGFASALASRDDVLPLTFSVDYWDYLGWRDTFARPEFTVRQKAYAKRLTRRGVYTPQMIVDGRAQTAAGRQGQVERLIDLAKAGQRAAPSIKRVDNRIFVGQGAVPKGGAEIWLIRYDPRGREVEVDKGENRGKVIAYRNVVRELVRLGTWTGSGRTLKLPVARDEGLRTVILLQQTGGGRVIALSAE